MGLFADRIKKNKVEFKNATYIIFIIFLLAGIYSCEKDVTVEVPEASTEIVVEGIIEPGQYPQILLTHTLPFFGTISTTDVIVNSIQGATVIVDDGVIFDTLIQIPNYGIYFGTHIMGEVGKSYNLRIFVEGKTITSVTNIPQAVKLDTTWWKPDGNRDSLGFAWAHLTDPDTLGNCYRWYAQRINHYTYGDNAGQIKDSTFIPSPGSVFEDKFINAKSFDFSFPRGKFIFSDKEDDSGEEEFFFKRGDTIVVKFCTIDRASFEFWRTEESQVQNNGNPFGSPQPISTNIKGGLGIWAGYSPSFDTIIAH
jgi:hypothetical protein